MKTITAEKCKDGYSVVIEDTRTIVCESDVRRFIKQEGLKIQTDIRNNKNHSIFAS